MLQSCHNKFTILRACKPGMKSKKAAEIFLENVSIFGTPLSFRGDRDSRFDSSNFTNELLEHNCEITLTSVDHHQLLGAAERTIGQVLQMMRYFINPTHANWQELLLPLQHAWNNNFCNALGATPAYYMLGSYQDSPVNG